MNEWKSIANPPPYYQTVILTDAPEYTRGRLSNAWTGYRISLNNQKIEFTPSTRKPTHWAHIPEDQPVDKFEIFYESNKDKLSDCNKEAIRLIYNEAKKL